MAFSPATFYTVAEELSSKAVVDGGHLRTLISRAYYGALIEARDAKGLSTRVRDGHEGVIRAYMDNLHDQVVADNLKALRTLRERADYQPAYSLTRNDGLKAIATCRKILSTLGKLPASVPTATSLAQQAAKEK